MSSQSSYQVRIDLHVHTRRFSACAEGLNPEQLPQMIEPHRLDGIVISEHDQLWPVEDIAALNRQLKHGRIYRGIEVSSCNGHFVVIGLEQLDDIVPGIDIQTLVNKANTQQAAVIWVHPQLCYGNTSDPCTSITMPNGLNAVEVISSVTFGERTIEAMAFAQRMGLASVGGSDAHILHQVGSAVTLFEALPPNEKALATAIRKGYCTALQKEKQADT